MTFLGSAPGPEIVRHWFRLTVPKVCGGNKLGLSTELCVLMNADLLTYNQSASGAAVLRPCQESPHPPDVYVVMYISHRRRDVCYYAYVWRVGTLLVWP